MVNTLRAAETEVNVVKIVECPRDAWQALPVMIAPQVKAAYLQQLVDAGFKHIDAVSFVSPAAVPQMADSEAVLKMLRSPDDVEIIGIVANLKGAQRAIATGAVQTLGFPYSISPQFLTRNQHQTPEESLQALSAISRLAQRSGLGFVAYISMAFGNPYGDPWSSALVREACLRLVDAGVTTISLADTVGVATTDVIANTFAEVLADCAGVETGVHLHAQPAHEAERITAAYTTGCRRFDSAIGGFGGCPFAQDELVGNIATEKLVEVLKGLGAALPSINGMDDLIAASAEIAEATSVAR